MIQDTCVLRKLTRVAFNNSLGGLLTHWRCSHSLQGYRHSCVIKVIALMAPQSIRIVIFLVLLRYSSEENRYIEKHFSFQRILCVIYRKTLPYVCMCYTKNMYCTQLKITIRIRSSFLSCSTFRCTGISVKILVVYIGTLVQETGFLDRINVEDSS